MLATSLLREMVAGPEVNPTGGRPRLNQALPIVPFDACATDEIARNVHIARGADSALAQ